MDNFSLIDFASFKGSVYCFKYLLLNKATVSKNTIELAFYSGNTEIIRILEDEIDLENCLRITAKYFHNDIFDWLIETKGAKTGQIKSTENIHALRYKLENEDEFDISIFNTQSIILTKYLFDNCVKLTDDQHYTLSFFNACLRGNIGMARFLYDKCGCCSRLNHSALSPLEIAVKGNQPEIIEFLMSVNGISYFSEDDLVYFAVKNRLADVLSLIIDIKGLKIDMETFNGVVQSQNTRILRILLSREFIRNCFDFRFYYEFCIQHQCYESFRCLVDFGDLIDCCKVIASSLTIEIKSFAKILIEKVEKLCDTEFKAAFKNKFGDINEFKQWFLYKCIRNNNIELVILLSREMNVKLERDMYIKVKWLIIVFKYFKQQEKRTVGNVKFRNIGKSAECRYQSSFIDH